MRSHFLIWIQTLCKTLHMKLLIPAKCHRKVSWKRIILYCTKHRDIRFYKYIEYKAINFTLSMLCWPAMHQLMALLSQMFPSVTLFIHFSKSKRGTRKDIFGNKVQTYNFMSSFLLELAQNDIFLCRNIFKKCQLHINLFWNEIREKF